VRKIFIGVIIVVLCMGMVPNAQQLAAFLNGEFQDPNEKTASGLSAANLSFFSLGLLLLVFHHPSV